LLSVVLSSFDVSVAIIAGIAQTVPEISGTFCPINQIFHDFIHQETTAPYNRFLLEWK
jgi:hypothetical protein